MSQPDQAGTGRRAARHSPRRWLAGRTLRARLIAGLVALLALACAAVGVATIVFLNQFLIGQLDSNLHSAILRYSQCLGQRNPSGESERPQTPTPLYHPSDCARQQADGTFTAWLQGGHVTNAYVTGAESYRAASRDKALIAGHPGEGQTYNGTLSAGLGSYRFLVGPRDASGVSYVAGMSMGELTATLHDVEYVEIWVFLGALVLIWLAGTGFVRLSLRPLRRVAATATRVTELPLASGEVSLPERVPDMDPRTEVGQVGAAFNRMLGHVEAALTRRAASENRLRRFAADASHELRTPLASIRGYSELALRSPGQVPGEVSHALRRVESESARMSLLVDELLLLAQLDAGRPLASDPVDLTRLAIDAASDARVATPDHRWQLELPDEPVMVRGDEHRLRQVLANLLANAGGHTPPGTTVTVALAEPQPGAGTVALSVTDDGPGIPPELQPGLFERFVRGDTARSHASGSTGLGLAIVDAVTAAHGGSVGVTSRPGRTSFVITLPALAGTSSAGPAGPDHAGPDHAGPDHAGPDHAGPDHAGPDHAAGGAALS